jgi:hypothetical protein
MSIGGFLGRRRARRIFNKFIIPRNCRRPPQLRDADHIDVRNLRDDVPSIDVGLVWRRGTRTREVVSEFIEVAREQSAGNRSR